MLTLTGDEPEYTTSIVIVDVIPAITTSVVFSTYEVTVTSCPSTVSNCPTLSASVITSFVPVSTTVCPVTLTSSHISEVTTSWTYSTEYPTESSISLPSVPTFTVPSDTALPWATDASSSSSTFTLLPPSPTSPIAGTTFTSSVTSAPDFTSISLFWPPVTASFGLPPTIISTHSDTITLGGPSTLATSTTTYTLSVVYSSGFTTYYTLTSVIPLASSGLPASGVSLSDYTTSYPLSTALPESTDYATSSLDSALPESSFYPLTSTSIPLEISSTLVVNSTTWPSGFFPSTTGSYSDATTGLPTDASTALPASSGLDTTEVSSYTPVTVITIGTLTSSALIPETGTGDSSAALPASTDASSTSAWTTPIIPPYVPTIGNDTTLLITVTNSLGSTASTTAAPVTTGYGNVSSALPVPTAPMSIFQGVGIKHTVEASAVTIILALMAAFL